MARHSKYNQKKQAIADKYVNETHVPYIEELALLLEVDMDTVRNWETKKDKKGNLKYPKFFGTIKRLKMKQKVELMRVSYSKDYNVSGAIFQLKVNHGMIESSKLDITSKGDKILDNPYDKLPLEAKKKMQEIEDEYKQD